MDDYMFGIVMREEANLKPLLESILGIRIRQIRFVEPQKTEKEGYASHGIRLDLFAQSEDGMTFNVEVQKTEKKDLPKRMRYYQSVIDINILAPGEEYENLQKSFVIFICSYDPKGEERCIYTFENRCCEDLNLPLGDETHKIIVNTTGTTGSISKEQKELMDYLNKGITAGTYTKQLDDAVRQVKASEMRRHEYMLMMIRDRDIREEGREEGVRETALGFVNILRDLGLNDEMIAEKIMQEFHLTKEAADKLIGMKKSS